MTRRLALCLLLLAASAPRAQALQSERNQVQEKLAAERAALSTLAGKRLGLDEALVWVQSLSAASAGRAAALATQAKALEHQLKLAQLQEALAREALAIQLRRLGPRLRTLYRVTRRSRLDLLLSAPDLARAFWRAWALKKLLRADVRLTDETRAVARYQDRARRRLEAVRALVLDQRSALQEASQRERETTLALQDALLLLRERARASQRNVKELERTDQELNRLIRQLERMPTTSGFGALRGRLPLPTAGLVEVGFGRVINPRFNTVVEHKGLDIRAPRGSAVRAVADGKVVWTGWLRGYGNLLILDHGGGYHTLMAHLSGFLHQVGDNVKGGEEVARVGDSGSLKGAYLYFEVRVRGLAVDPATWVSSL